MIGFHQHEKSFLAKSTRPAPKARACCRMSTLIYFSCGPGVISEWGVSSFQLAMDQYVSLSGEQPTKQMA